MVKIETSIKDISSKSIQDKQSASRIEDKSAPARKEAVISDVGPDLKGSEAAEALAGKIVESFQEESDKALAAGGNLDEERVMRLLEND